MTNDTRNDTIDDIHALSGAYSIDAVDDVERARFERHLAGCAACQSEVASLVATAAELSALVQHTPPASLRDKVMRDIARVRPLPPVLPVTQAETAQPSAPAASTDQSRRRDAQLASRGPTPGRLAPRRVQRPRPDSSGPARWSRGLVAAAAAAVLAVGGVAVWRTGDDRPAPTVAQQVLAAADASRVAQTFPGGATATVVRSPSLGKAVIVTSKMPAAPAGKIYQLWLQDASGHMTSAGLMPAGSDQVVVLDGNARAATGAGITVEPTGGSPQPTSDPIALFSFA